MRLVLYSFSVCTVWVRIKLSSEVLQGLRLAVTIFKIKVRTI